MLSKNRLKRVVASRHFWIVAAMLAAAAFLHYFPPQTSLAPLTSLPLTRHAIERIIFIIPVAGAAFAFGQVGGLITLAIAVVIMLPRVFFISDYPTDSLVETIGIAVVSYIVIWMIETQEKEKRLRQTAVARLQAINDVASIVTESLDLEQILEDALDKVMEVTGLDAGLMFLLDRKSQELHLAAYRGISREAAAGVDRLIAGEGFCGRVAQSGEPMLVDDSSRDPRLTRLAVQQEGLRGQIIVPLKSTGEVQGVLAVATRRSRQFIPEELELITAISNQIGVAIENARLYENMRFYIRQITRAQEDERKRIARELHDDTAQALIALSRRLDELASSHDQTSASSSATLGTGSAASFSESMMGRLEELHDLIDGVLRGVRRFSRDLRPSVLDDLGLLPALEGLMADLEEDGIRAELKVYGERRRLPPDAELALFRIVQETLNNVRRHSQASRVVTVMEFAGDRVKISVADNGQGFELPDRTEDLVTTGKLGLVGMHERARLLDATLLIQSEPGKGTTVIVEVPISPVPKDAGDWT